MERLPQTRKSESVLFFVLIIMVSRSFLAVLLDFVICYGVMLMELVCLLLTTGVMMLHDVDRLRLIATLRRTTRARRLVVEVKTNVS